ncbi:hypothetical protein GCM10011409_01890 [Lentibacillus populi]|uniref:Uncharacterized protein n=1 Tax=Lentibacillus populi TaxID=1827502 RepID=A0A9W5TUV0_9BACI|nr:hypothetical protein GCM10011409_01890 [Lentibacillus populi]
MLRPAKQGGSVLLRKAAVLTEQTTVGDKGNMPLHRGMPTLGAKPVLSRPTFLPKPMLTYRTEAGVAY